jgi:TRAP-type C4-dicarboxylate transport system substrate-binding protein
VKIVMYPGESLTSATQCHQGVVNGVSDIGYSVLTYTRGRFPLMCALDNPLGYPDATCSSHVANEMYARFKPKEFDNVHVLYFHMHGPGYLHTSKPVHTLDDLKGMKIRAGGMTARIVEALGGTPISMTQGEVYEALKKGIVQGTLVPPEALKGWKQAEVIKSTTKLDCIGYAVVFVVAMNLKKWNSLPTDVQNVMTEVSRQWVDKHADAWNQADKDGLEFTKSLGNEVITLSPDQQTEAKKRVNPLMNEYAQELEKNGLPGKKFMEEAVQLIQQCK